MQRHTTEFLGVEPELTAYETSAAVVIPCPWEQTVSYGAGTAAGPEAILEASHQVETWDEIRRDEPYRRGGIATVPPINVEGVEAPEAFSRLEAVVGKVLEQKSPSFGYDAQNDTYVDLVSKGIIDPAKVVRTALQDAASVAGLLITTEAGVAEAPKKDDPMPMSPGGMGGMDMM